MYWTCKVHRPVYVRYRSQVVTFARTVGAAGMGPHPYECQHVEEEDPDFTDRVKMLIRESVNSVVMHENAQRPTTSLVSQGGDP
jgi:hypothetical protein